MKRFFLVAAMLVMTSAAMVMAQPRAIGLRGTIGVGLSYEHQLKQNMLSVDVDFLTSVAQQFVPGVEGVVTYDWINPFGTSFPWNKRGEWNWYMGVGAGVGASFSKSTYPMTDILSGSTIGTIQNINNSIFFGAAGRVGVEYNFWFPLQLSVDWRPVIGPAFNLNTSRSSFENLPDIRVDNTMTVDYNVAGLVIGAVSLSIRYKF